MDVQNSHSGGPVTARAGAEMSLTAEIRQVVADLRELTLPALADRLDRMFDGADDFLFGLAGRATTNQEQRLYFDTMRVVRLGRADIARRFREHIAASFEPGHPPAATAPGLSFDELSLQKSEAVEENIALANMASKAESLYREQIWEISRRLEWLIEARRAPILPEAFMPRTLVEAFRVAIAVLKVDFPTVLVLYKLCDRLVLGELSEFYAGVLMRLKSSGAQTAPPRRSGPVAPGALDATAGLRAGAQTGAASLAAAASAFLPLTPGPGVSGTGLSLDPMTAQALRSASAAIPMSAQFYGDAQLAADLSAAAQGQAIPAWGPRAAAAYVQRTGLVGKMLNDILADPNLPDSLKPRFEELRLSAVKSALKDVGFFADPAHPVRRLINEMAALATQARIAGIDALTRIGELVAQVQQQFDLAADQVRRPSPLARPIIAEDVERFLADEEEQAEKRRQLIIAKVRGIIAEELQLRSARVRVPERARGLLDSAWAPMMAVTLLRHGADSPEWVAGMALLERALLMLSPGSAAARGSAARPALLHDLRAAFDAVGLVRTRTEPLLADFEAALDQRELGGATAPANDALAPQHPAPPDPQEVLDTVIVTGSWFKIWDRETQNARWLRAIAHYPGKGCVAFAEFNGKNTVLVKSDQLIDDLVAGRSESVQLSPAAREVLNELAMLRDTSRSALPTA